MNSRKLEEEYRLGYNSGYAKGYEAAEQKQCRCHCQPRKFRSLGECKRELDALIRQQVHTLIIPDDLYYDYKAAVIPDLKNVNFPKENLMYMGITITPRSENF